MKYDKKIYHFLKKYQGLKLPERELRRMYPEMKNLRSKLKKLVGNGYLKRTRERTTYYYEVELK